MPTALGLYVEVQLEVVVLPMRARVQGLLPKLPVPSVLKVTWPEGKLCAGVSVSLTVAVQVLGLFTGMLAAVQLTVVDVLRVVTNCENRPAPAVALVA